MREGTRRSREMTWKEEVGNEGCRERPGKRRNIEGRRERAGKEGGGGRLKGVSLWRRVYSSASPGECCRAGSAGPSGRLKAPAREHVARPWRLAGENFYTVYCILTF